LAINVAEVTTPSVWALTMARFTPDVNPKSSALTMRRRISGQFSSGAFYSLVVPIRSMLVSVDRPQQVTASPELTFLPT
jgi:hypothetical protein